MYDRNELAEKAVRLDPGLSKEDISLPIAFHLTPSVPDRRVDGIAFTTRDKVFVYINGEKITEAPLSDIREFTFRSGVGCVFIEFTLKSGETLVYCRDDMQYLDLFASAAREMNKHLKGEDISYDFEKEINNSCPKCGRRYRPGSKVCEMCVPKRHYFKRLWQIAKPYHTLIYFSIAFYFIIAAANLLPPYLNRILVDDYIKADEIPGVGGYIAVILSMLAAYVVTMLLSMLRSVGLIKASNGITVTLRELVFDKIQKMSISRISKRTSGELMNRVSNNTAELSGFIANDFGAMAEQIIILLAVGIYLFTYDWKLALFIILPTPVAVYANFIFRSFTRKIYHRQWQFTSRANSILHDTFSGIRVVKAFGMEKREISRYDEANAAQRDAQLRAERFFANFNPIIGFFMGIGEFVLHYYVGSRILGGEMTLGEMTQFSSYVSIIYGPLSWISTFPRRLIRVSTTIVKIFDVVDEEPDVADRENAIDKKIDGYVTFDDVSFGYDKTSYVLKHITAEVKPGEMIGIVGKSGVGKSTLINLIMRMYDVSEGSIKIDGIDIRELSQQSLRSQIGVVLQETFLFSGSIYDNIAYAKPDASREEVINAAKAAGAHSFIMKLPNAYNTIVGERGHTLSGGERQRVAIARALLHDPRILILDEATASLDTETEKQIQDALQKLTANRTTFAIAHRLSTLRNATRLFVLDKGELAEVGTHEELIKKKGIYYGLVMAQRQMSRMSPKNQ